MRVSILTATSAWGGAENHALNLAKFLRHRGHAVTIVELGHTVYDGHVDHSTGIDLVSVQLPGVLEDLTFAESIKLLKNLPTDVGVFEKGDLNSANWKFDVAARLCFKRYFTIEQLICAPMPPKIPGSHLGGLLPGLSLWWHGTYWTRYARSLGPHTVVCVSESIRSRLLQEYNFSPQKAITIHNGIDAEQFRPDWIFRAAARRSWAIPEDGFIMGAVGRLAPVKGYETAVRLFKELKSSMRDRSLWLVLVGDGPERVNLECLVKESGLEEWVRFPGSTDRPWEIYPAFDVFIMPSSAEGLPHSLLEAMGAGSPGIAYDVGGISEIIASPNLGWLIREGDSGAFLAAMSDAVQRSPEQLGRMGARARKQVLSHFASDVLLGRLANLIEFGREDGVQLLTRGQKQR